MIDDMTAVIVLMNKVIFDVTLLDTQSKAPAIPLEHKMNEVSSVSGDITDSSGADRTGKVIYEPITNPNASTVSTTNGKFGNAFNFGQSSATDVYYIELDNSPALDLTGDYSYALWLWLDSTTPSTQPLISRGGASITLDGGLYITSNNELRSYTYYSGTDAASITTIAWDIQRPGPNR